MSVVPTRALSLLDHALAHYDAGFKIFPLIPNGKTPMFEKPAEWAKDVAREMVEQYWAHHPDCNIAIVPQLSGHYALDIDVKDGKNGNDTLFALEQFEDLTFPGPTWEAQTPTGGTHRLFLGEMPNIAAGKLGRGLDIRGGTQYIVAPGSKVAAGEYVLIRDIQPIPGPEWLPACLASVNDLPAHAQNPACSTLDNPEDIEQAITYLNDAPPAVQGSGGDDQLYRVFTRLKDFGISQELASQLALRHYNHRCLPPWDFDNGSDESHWLEKLENAYRYSQNRHGSASREVIIQSAVEDFKDLPIPAVDTPQLKTVTPLKYARGHALQDLTRERRKWVIKNMAAENYLTLITAPGGTGKTNLIIALAFAVVTGKTDYLGENYKVEKRGPIIICNGEDPIEEMALRIEALRLKMGIAQEALQDIYILSGQDNDFILASFERGQVVERRDTIDRLKAFLVEIKAVAAVFDPLVNLHLVPENDNSAMIQITNIFRSFAKLGVAVFIVHHTNKAALNIHSDTDNQSHARGAYAITGAVRFAFVLTTMREDDAKAMGINVEERKKYFKMENVKSNLSMSAAKADWFITSGQNLPSGESVGVSIYHKLSEVSEKLRGEKELENTQRLHVMITEYFPKDSLQWPVSEIHSEAMRHDIPCPKNMNRFREEGVFRRWLNLHPEFKEFKQGKNPWVLMKSETTEKPA